MKKTKKFVVMALASVMLLGATLAPSGIVNAACNHSPQAYSYTSSTSNKCGEHENCTVVTTTYYSGAKCKLCGGVFNIKPTHATVAHRR